VTLTGVTLLGWPLLDDPRGELTGVTLTGVSLLG
jgi:hypothetical protein